MYNVFPSLMDWLPGPHHRLFQNFTELQGFISEQIQRHRETRQSGEPRDFIDCFLDQMDKVQHPSLALNSPHGAQSPNSTAFFPPTTPTQEQDHPDTHFLEETLVMTTHNLFFGGTETTSTTLRYGLLILLKHQEVAGLENLG